MKSKTRLLRAAIIFGVSIATAAPAWSRQLTPGLVEPESARPIESVITAKDAHARITASVPTTVLRNERPLTGDYIVRATFRSTDTAVPGEYGLVVGGRAATAFACVARAEGTFAVHRGPISSTGASVWAPIEAISAPARTTGEDHFTIRVAGAMATCSINGRDIARVTAAPGHLDGVPGIYVGPGSTVDVIGWRSEAVVPLVTVPADPRR